MLQDGLILTDASVATNFQIQNGMSLPVAGLNVGELFFLTSGTVGLYVYTGSAWLAVGNSGSLSFTGDVTGSGTSGSPVAMTIANVNGTPGSFGSVTQIPTLTVNAKGQVTASSSVNVADISITESQIADGLLLARVDGNESITGSWTFTNVVTGVDPTLSTHLATKSYVDSVASGLDPKNAVRVATTANITLSGTQTIDGVAVVAGDRVLVKNQTTASQNGIYVVAAGAWARSADADNTPTGEVTSGMYVLVTEGATNAAAGFVLTTANPITLGTTSLSFAQFSSPGGTVAGGTNTQIQFNNGGTLNGVPGFTFNSATGALSYYVGNFATPDQSSFVAAGSAAGTGAEFKIFGGETQTGTGGIATISGGNAFGNGGNGGAVSVGGGGVNVGNGNGGSANISGGFVNGSGQAGHVNISGGGGTNAGYIRLRTNSTERFRVLANGAWSVGVTGAETGTSGQALVSNGGAAAPTWQSIDGSMLVGTVPPARLGSGTANSTTYLRGDGTWSSSIAAANISGGAVNQIPFQSAASTTAFSTKFTWTDSSNTLRLGDGIDNSFVFMPNVTSASAAGDLRLVAPNNSGTGAGGSVILFAGTGSSAAGGRVTLNGGASSAGTGGEVSLNSGQGVTGSGAISITAGTTAGATGAITISGGTIISNSGTAGVVTVSGADVSGSFTATAGNVVIRGGSASASSGTGGNVEIRGGIGGSVGGVGGHIRFSTGPGSSLNERFRILGNGAWSVGTDGISTGTAGQVLTSNGSTSAPSWTTGSFTLGNVAVNLGSTTTSLTGMSSITSTSFVGALNGNASTATALQNTRTINGVAFNGTANIVVTADASTLTGSSLASGVVSSSLTSVGTLSSLTVGGNVTAADPSAAGHLTTKSYVDNLVSGLSWKNSVRAGTTANITLSAPQTIDGVSVIAGDRVLVKNQTTTSQNGVYVVAAGAWTRAADFDASPTVGEVNGAAVFVREGATQAETAWTQTSEVVTIGTDPITFVLFSATGGAVAKAGDTMTGQLTITTTGIGASQLNLRRTTEVGGYSWLQMSRTDGTRALELIAGSSSSAYGIPVNAVGINAQGSNGLHFSTNDTLRMSIAGDGTVSIPGALSNGASATGTTTTSVTSTATTTIDSIVSASFRTVKYIVQVVDTQFHAVEILVIHDGTTVWKTEYAEIFSNAALGTFDAVITSGNLILNFTASAATSKTVKVQRIAITA